MYEQDLREESRYHRRRAEEFLALRAGELGVSRRRLIQLLLGGASAAALGLLPGWARAGVAAGEAPAVPEVLKPTPPEFFVRNGSNLEMRWDALYGRGYLVPTPMFFVRNNGSTPRIEAAGWQLRVEGSGVARPRAFGYEELLAMPSVSVVRAVECAGNGRNFFERSHGRKIKGTPWNLGGIGVAEWTGVPLREVLERAGLKASAREVMPVGLDDKQVQRPFSVEKALEEDTLLVYAMNGEVLPPDHGFPVRVLLPGWVGIGHIKWVGSLQVSETPLFSEYNTRRYVLIGPDYPVSEDLAVAGALGQVLTTQKVKSAFELPWDGQVPAGPRLLRGRSWSGEGAIARVEVSVDGGRTWRPARLREPNIGRAWVRWDIDWDASPGRHELKARATDARGNRQPDRIPFNEEGYAHWAVVGHPLGVV